LVDPLIRDRSQLFVEKKDEASAAGTNAAPTALPIPDANMPGLLDIPANTNLPPAAAPK
jgi:hypothetical protein